MIIHLKARGTNLSQGLRYDAAHERRRKQQLSLLYGRTKDQVEEEQRLIMELRKIEARRKERERKKQDLQKLISLVNVHFLRKILCSLVNLFLLLFSSGITSKSYSICKVVNGDLFYKVYRRLVNKL